MKKLQKVFSILLTVCMCMSLLSISAFAEENVYICGQQAHTHDETCYDQGLTVPACGLIVCELEAHAHDADCEYHTHDDDCQTLADCGYAEDDNDCGQPDHTHGETCVYCTVEDGVHEHSADCCSLHVHDADCVHGEHVTDCYTAYDCGKNEGYDHEEHNHVVSGCHFHVDGLQSDGGCYIAVTDCGLAEHTHSGTCEPADDTHVAAIIGGTSYPTLEAAVDAALEGTGDETVVIKLLADCEFTEKRTINKDITIEGDYTITRNAEYKGQWLAVSAGATLTLEDVVVDGNNDWTFLKNEYYDAVENGVRVSNGSVRYTQYEEGAPVATATVIAIAGEVILDGATFQNHVGNNDSSLFWVGSGAELIMTDAVIDHNTKGGSSVVASVSGGGYWEINGNTVISNNHNHGGNGTLSYMSGTAVINNGEFFNNTGVDNNGYIMMIYGGGSKVIMNGGYIHDNGALYGNNNGWNCAFYVYGNGSDFTMNGGIIEQNRSSSIPGIASNGSNALITLNGSDSPSGSDINMVNTVSGRGFTTKDVYSYCPVNISETVNSAKNGFYNNVTNTGTLNGDSWFYSYAMTYSGGGTFNGDVTVLNGAETTMVDGQWINGVVWVKAVGNDTTLTVKPGAKIDGIQVRVLDSVESGDCTNAEQASAAQAASYVEEEGANVESPVLYYHRLTSAQKKNIVITYDYNGGLDACGWSGTQVTTEGETYLPTADELARPFRKGYTLAGWEFADDNNPECLTMESGETYYTIGDETIATLPGTLRLIAQWTNNDSGDNSGGGDSNDGGEGGSTVDPGNGSGSSSGNGSGSGSGNGSNSGSNSSNSDTIIEDEDTPLAGQPADDEDTQSAEEDTAEIDDEDVPLASIPEEDVPLAVAPMTGDAAALWLALSALSGTGLAGVTFLGRKKNKED